MKLLRKSLASAGKMRRLLYIVCSIYIMSFVAGYVLAYLRVPIVVEYAEVVRKSSSENPLISPVISALREGNLVFAIAYTFMYNLLIGAFLWTTFPAVIPFGGGFASVAISAYRGFTVGVGNYSVFGQSVGRTVVAIGTDILELGGYVFSATAGINVTLSSIFPRRYGVKSRRVAISMAWEDAARLYVIVSILLALGAIWEIAGIYVTAKRT